MIFEIDNIIIEYSDIDSHYIDKLIDVFKSKYNNIVDFFKLSNFNSGVRIKIWNDLEEYKKNLVNAWKNQGIEREYQDNFIANTEDGNINMLSFELVREIPDFKYYSVEEFCYNVCHEFVHLCQQKVGSINDGWFWEVLATNLGNPECQREVKIHCSFDDVKYRFDKINGYGVCYTIGKYLFSNYSDYFILELVLDNDKLLHFEEQLFSEVVSNQKYTNFHK